VEIADKDCPRNSAELTSMVTLILDAPEQWWASAIKSPLYFRSLIFL